MKIIFLILCNLYVIFALREDECIEVGFARTSYVMVDESYKAAKEKILAKWALEDEQGFPTYSNMYPQMKNITRSAELLEETSKEVLRRIKKTRVGKRCGEEHILVGVEKHVTPLINMDKEFAEELGLVMSFRCLVGSPYPNVDGTCINEQNPDMGGIGAKFLRLIPPVAGKGGFSLRQSRNADKTLPSSREVSRAIKMHIKKPKVSKLFIDLGHFIARDSFSIPEAPVIENVNCCEKPDSIECEPIFISETDTWYKSIKCLNYRRSAPAQAILGHREAFSSVSSYLDATPVYGSSNEDAFKKKTSYFGYLHGPEPAEDSSNRKVKCQFPESFKDCFDLEKDVEYIEDIDLLLTLEHNKIAETLATINPHFDDSLLYNEARRIVIAEYNNIIYGEYLRILLGNATIEKHMLLPGSEGPGSGYLAEVNPGILTSFAVGAFRNPAMITDWKNEWGATNILNTRHYEAIKEDFFQDLLAMDIQRGRDHGLPSYSSWRSFCDNGKNFGDWNQLEDVIPKDALNDLKKLYSEEAEDLDFMVSLLEEPEEGAVVGKTIICILADQFARLKSGNRLYWEHETSLMQDDQKAEIRKMTAAGLLCRHLSVEVVPRNPFLPFSDSNPPVECQSIERLDLIAWKDTSLIEVMKKEKEKKEAGITEDITPAAPESAENKADAIAGSIEKEENTGEEVEAEPESTETITQTIIETVDAPSDEMKTVTVFEEPVETKTVTETIEEPIDETITSTVLTKETLTKTITKEVVIEGEQKSGEAEISYDHKTNDPNARREELTTTMKPSKEEL